jgi:hypothetical protein
VHAVRLVHRVLARYLKAELPGIVAAGTLVVHLLPYADDLIVPADAPAHLHTALNCIASSAWGMEVGTGLGTRRWPLRCR